MQFGAAAAALSRSICTIGRWHGLLMEFAPSMNSGPAPPTAPPSIAQKNFNFRR
jgi:hypothetical protein